MATCGKCTATNVTVEHVRACYAMEGVRVAVATRPSSPQPRRVQVGNVVTLADEPGYWTVEHVPANEGWFGCTQVRRENRSGETSRTPDLADVTQVFPDMNAATDHRIAQAAAEEKDRVSKILHGDNPSTQRSTYYASPYETRGDATGGTEQQPMVDVPGLPGVRVPAPQPKPWATVDKLRAEVAKHLHYETGSSTGKKRQGYFAVDIDGELKFLRIKKMISGRYAGRVFVDSMGSDTGYPVRRPETLERYLGAVLVDPVAAAKRFADELGQCSDCGRPLTNEESRARGVGPDCWAKR